MEGNDIEWLQEFLGEEYDPFQRKDSNEKEKIIKEKLRIIHTTDKRYNKLFTIAFKYTAINNNVHLEPITNSISGVTKKQTNYIGYDKPCNAEVMLLFAKIT